MSDNPVTSILGGVASALGGMFGGGKSAAPAAPPPVVAPAPMPVPVPDDAAALAVKKRQAAALSARSGRLSTILTDGGTGSGGIGDKLGD